MCGIVGYIGKEQAAPILLEGLARLEYRGYDSAGICVAENGMLDIAKCKGRLANLAEKTAHGALMHGTVGIGRIFDHVSPRYPAIWQALALLDGVCHGLLSALRW